MKKIKLLFLAITMIASSGVMAQVGINTDGTDPDGSAMLDVKSTDKGFLPPRMTQAQRDGISSPAAGLLVYQTDETPGYYYYTGTDWIGLVGAGPGAISGSSSFFIDCEGYAYPTITIGNQVWVAENLRVTHYNNGDAIPNVTDNTAWGALSTGAYCWYDNDQATNEKYGALYNWYTVNDSRGLCPDGWHVPTAVELNILTTYLGGQAVAGEKMKTISNLWNSTSYQTNTSRFSGLPGDLRDGDGGWYYVGWHGYWWSSTEYSSGNACSRTLSCFNGYFPTNDMPKQCGLSVRCLRD